MSSMFKSTATVGSMTLISRILGLFREMVVATTFGATGGMDAFLIAFKIPNFLRRLFAEGAFSQAFVPVLSEYQGSKGEEELKSLIQRVSGTLGLIVFIVSIIGMLSSSLWAALFAPGFIHEAGDKLQMSSEMLRITFPYLFFITLTALSGAVLNVFHKFAVPAFTPVFLNICMISAAWFFSSDFKVPEMALAWGVCISGLVQVLFQLPFLYRLGLLVWPKWGWNDPGVRHVLRLMLPALFGASVAQIGLLLDTIFASFLPTGSVSWLYYSDRLMQFPLGILGVALGTVVLPHLSRQHAKADQKGYEAMLDWALRLVILLALPAAIFTGLFSGPILVTLFGYHQFSLFDVEMSQRSLIAFSLGLLFFIAVKVLVSAFYARQNTKTPVKIGVITMVCNLMLNAILIWPLAHAGLALATSLASGVNCLLLYVTLRKQGWYTPLPGWRRILLPVIVSLVLIGLLVSETLPSVQVWYALSAGSRAWHLGLWLVGGCVAYFGLLLLLGVRRHHFVSQSRHHFVSQR